MVHPDTHTLIFAKAPEPGRVKTRLVPSLGPRAAADLHRELLAGTVARLAAGRETVIELWCSPDPACAPFPALAARHGLALYCQAEGDLGERMRQAAADALTRAAAVLLVGTDCPLLDVDYLDAAARELEKKDAVLGPAEDGGYVLLGLRRAAPELFADMPWGTEGVAALARVRLSALGWDWAELPTLWDLDRPADLVRYRGLTPGAG